MRQIARQAAALLASILVAACAANAGEMPQVRTVDEIDLQQGFALKGYDPVAYFAEGGPAAGNTAIRYQWRGATWLFSTEEHRKAFMADPARYAPQFGGYCAFAVSRGTTADGDPLQWAVVDDKLYVGHGGDVAKGDDFLIEQRMLGRQPQPPHGVKERVA